MPFPAEGVWPVVANADLPFVVAVHEASRRLDIPAEVAREALRHAIRNRDVIVRTPVTADGETTYVHIEDYSVDVKYEPDVVVDATTFDMWLIDRRRVACKRVLTPMIDKQDLERVLFAPEAPKKKASGGASPKDFWPIVNIEAIRFLDEGGENERSAPTRLAKIPDGSRPSPRRLS